MEIGNFWRDSIREEESSALGLPGVDVCVQSSSPGVNFGFAPVLEQDVLTPEVEIAEALALAAGSVSGTTSRSDWNRLRDKPAAWPPYQCRGPLASPRLG